MTFLTWAIRLFLITLLVVFAVQNNELVKIRLTPEQFWQAPLVLILLAFFASGVVIGILSMLGILYRQRREISRLKREFAVKPPEKIIPEPPAIA